MSKINFQELLNVKAEAVERPKTIPEGTFLFQLGKLKFDSFKGQDGAEVPVAKFPAKIIDMKDDVDADALKAVGGTVIGENMQVTFYLDMDSQYRILDAAEKYLGVETSGKSVLQILESFSGQTTGGFVKQTPSKDGSEMYSKINRLLKWE